MRLIKPFDPSVATTNQEIDVGSADRGSKMLLYNESPYNVQIDFYDGNVSILHAWEARFWTLDGDVRQVGWTVNSQLSVTAPPISLILGELYGANEKLEGSYPMALVRQANVGNAISTSVASSNTLVNTGNPANTQVVQLNSTSNGGNTVTLTNDGVLALLVTIAGTLVTAIQTAEADPIVKLGAAARLVEVLGNLTIDGNVTHTGTSLLTGVTNATATINANGGLNTNTLREDTNGNTAIDLTGGTGAMVIQQALTLLSTLLLQNATAIQAKNSTGTAINLLTMNASNQAIMRSGAVGAAIFMRDSAGTDLWGGDSGGFNIISKKIFDASGGNIVLDNTGAGCKLAGNHANLLGLNYYANGVNKDFGLDCISTFSGAASGTFNHGMTQAGAAIAPRHIIPVINTAGSATMGYDTVTSTQCHITLGAALSFNTWCFR